eukprot:jgi/Mesvir1/25606/Mv01834-RA.1
MVGMFLGAVGAKKVANVINKGISAIVGHTPFGALFGNLFNRTLSAKCKARAILTFGFSNCKPQKPRVLTKEEETLAQMPERYSFKPLEYVPDTKKVTFIDKIPRYDSSAPLEKLPEENKDAKSLTS